MEADLVEAVTPDNILKDARSFLTELEANNTREWFHTNKKRYDSALKRPAEIILSETSKWIEAEYGIAPRQKLFRPQRDLRFSADKTPYHTHLHMMWSFPDGRAWMLGISTTYATAGGGVMQFEPKQLESYRAAVDSDAGAALVDLLDAQNWRLDEPSLKRVPAPYPSDHPRAAMLRRKGLLAWQDDLDDALTSDPLGCLATRFAGFKPLIQWLDAVT